MKVLRSYVEESKAGKGGEVLREELKQVMVESFCQNKGKGILQQIIRWEKKAKIGQRSVAQKKNSGRRLV